MPRRTIGRSRSLLFLAAAQGQHDLPLIPIAWPKYIYAVNTDVHGFSARNRQLGFLERRIGGINVGPTLVGRPMINIGTTL